MKSMAMKLNWMKVLIAAGMMAGAAMTWAADKTITGEGKCGKLHETTIEVKEGDKTVLYHLALNEVSKEFHAKICSKSAKVMASGDVKEVEGRWVMTPTRIMLVQSKSAL